MNKICPVCSSERFVSSGRVWFTAICGDCDFTFSGSSGILYELTIRNYKEKLLEKEKRYTFYLNGTEFRFKNWQQASFKFYIKTTTNAFGHLVLVVEQFGVYKIIDYKSDGQPVDYNNKWYELEVLSSDNSKDMMQEILNKTMVQVEHKHSVNFTHPITGEVHNHDVSINLERMTYEDAICLIEDIPF